MLAKFVPELEAFFKLLFGGVVLVGLAYGMAAWQSHKELAALRETLAISQAETLKGWEETKGQLTSLEKLTRSQSEELRALAARKPDYIVKTTTVLAGETVVLGQLPQRHTFHLNGDIPVAEFSQENGQYSFESHSLEFTTQVVTSKKSTLTNLYVVSDADGIKHQLPHSTEVTKIDEWKRIQPELQISGSLTYPWDAGVALQAPILHVTRSVDVLVPRVFIGQRFGVGVDAVNYNLGKPLPILQDTWVAAGVQTDLVSPYFSISIGTKL